MLRQFLHNSCTHSADYKSNKQKNAVHATENRLSLSPLHLHTSQPPSFPFGFGEHQTGLRVFIVFFFCQLFLRVLLLPAYSGSSLFCFDIVFRFALRLVTETSIENHPMSVATTPSSYDGVEGEDDFICVIDFICKRLLREMSVDPFKKTVEVLMSWGSEKLKMQKLRPLQALPALMARHLEDMTINRRRAIVHINLTTVLNPLTGEPIFASSVNSVSRTLQTVLVQCPSVIIAHFENRYVPGSLPLAEGYTEGEHTTTAPSVEVMLPLLQKLLAGSGTTLRFLPTFDMDVITSLGVGEAVLLENLLHFEGETSCEKEFAIKLSKCGDVLVCDAFPSLSYQHASTKILPFLVGDYCLGHSCAEFVDTVHSCSSNATLPCIVAFGGCTPLTGLRSAALIEAVTIADDVLLAGRPALLYFYVTATGLEPGVTTEDILFDPPLETEECNSMRKAIQLSIALSRSLTVPTDHTLLAVRMGKRSNKPGKPPKKLFRYETVSGGLLPFPLSAGRAYVGIGEQTVARYSERLASAKTGIFIDVMGAVKIPTMMSPEYVPIVNPEMCPTMSALVVLADTANVQSKNVHFIGDSLCDLVESASLTHKIRTVVPGMMPALSLFLA